MEAATVTSKGQIVIPSRLRKRHGIRKGTRVCFVEQGPDLVLKPLTDEYIRALQGSLGSGGRVLKALLEEKKRERRH